MVLRLPTPFCSPSLKDLNDSIRILKKFWRISDMNCLTDDVFVDIELGLVVQKLGLFDNLHGRTTNHKCLLLKGISLSEWKAKLELARESRENGSSIRATDNASVIFFHRDSGSVQQVHVF